MAESPVGCLPDVYPGDERNIALSDNNVTDTLVSRNQRKVRRSWGPSAGLRRWAYPSTALTQADRFILRTFLQNRKGEFDSFYYWNPIPRTIEDGACGTIAAAPTVVVPYRVTNGAGGIIGTLTDVRVGGVTKAFTRRSLVPRPGTYAAPRFDGATGTIDCGASSTLKFAGDISISVWLRPSSITGTRAILSNLSASASGVDLLLVAGVPTFITAFASSQNTATCNTAIAADVWTMVTVVKSGTNVTFYLNGIAKNTVGSITNQAAATISLKLGTDSFNTPYSGLMSEVRVYSNAISAGEVTNIYNGAATPSANLVGWWRLTDGTGTAADLSGYGNTGTLNSGATWISGEEEITFTGGAQTGAVTVWGLLRDRAVVVFGGPSRGQRFVGSTPLTVFDLNFVEVY